MRAAAAAAGAIALAAVAAPRLPVPKTVHTARGPVAAVAQDGDLLAWLDADATGCNAVHVLQADGSTVTTPEPEAGSMTCHWDVATAATRLALAAGASAALWTLHEAGGAPVDYVMSATLGGPETRVDRLSHASDDTGLWLGGVAGGGTTLAYSAADVEYADKMACLSGGSCKRKIAGGGVYVVSGGQERLLPGSRPALALATAAGRIAYVQAAAAPIGPPVASGRLPVRVVAATSGAAVSSVRPQGFPLALALAPNVLALLTRNGKHDLVTWYGATTGLQLGSLRVSSSAAPALAASNRLVVYRVGRTLRGISLRTGRARTLAQTPAPPLDFSLSGSQLAWGENRAATSRVRVLVVS